MKIAPLNTVMQYNIATKKVNFGNNDNNNKGTDTPINQPQQTKPTLQQLQAHSGISFSGTKEDVLAFIDKSGRLVKFVDTFSKDTPIEEIRGIFSSNPEDLEAIFHDNKGGKYSFLGKANGEQIAVFAEVLGDRAQEVLKKALLVKDDMGLTPLHYLNAESIYALANIFGEDTGSIFDELLIISDNENGVLPIHPKYCDLDKFKALMEVAPKSLATAMEKKHYYRYDEPEYYFETWKNYMCGATYCLY